MLHKNFNLLCIFFMLTLLVAGPAHAIVNLERAIIGPTTDGFHTRLDLLASGTSGNSETQRTRIDLLNLRKYELHTDFLQLQHSYGTSRGVADTDNSFAHYRHRYEMTPTRGIEAYAQINRDPFARLTERTLWGGGARWILFEENQKTAAYFGLGMFREQEIRAEAAGTTDRTDFETWRANAYLVLKYQFNHQVSLINNTYYQPALSDTSNFRLLEQATLMLKVVENLDLKLSLEITYDSIPPQTVKPMDVIYSSGLAFSF